MHGRMPIRAGFVESGGWMLRTLQARPKALLFSAVALGWIAVWLEVAATWSSLTTMSVWIRIVCILVLLPHPMFLYLAARFWLHEEPRQFEYRVRNPARELRKLY